MHDLSDTARTLMKPGKGILAADESNETADKRLKSYGIEPGPEMRRKDRDLFLATPGIEEYLSGVILYEETLTQKDTKDGLPEQSLDGVPFPKLLTSRGIVPGIKVDQGLEPLAESPEESITKGLLGLPERLAEYRAAYGTGFTKWRAAIVIDGDRLPSATALVENAKRLAGYALEAQKAGMVPMVEPEVLLAGKHSRLRAQTVLESTLRTLFDTLLEQAVDCSALILKTSMVLSGNDNGRMDSPEEVAESTLTALMASVPSEVPGIVFLSGGQTPDQATENLRAILVRAREVGAPWPLTFSFSRALQDEALATWRGKDENLDEARTVFLERLKKVSAALVP